jgi:hypothetical protein
MYKHNITITKAPEVDSGSTLTMLGAHFNVARLEKYEDAIVKGFFYEGMKKYQRQQRVGEHLRSKVQKYMGEQLRKRWGPYISVLRRKDKFFCNFCMVYKTELGRLYQSSIFPDLFITSHALERYEERMPDLETFELTSGINRAFKKQWGTSPTAYDSLDSILSTVTEYGVPEEQGDTLILNLTFGFLILDVFENFSVAKTFLAPDMSIPFCEWFMREEDPKSLDSSILEKSFRIDKPLSFRCHDGKWESNRSTTHD